MATQIDAGRVSVTWDADDGARLTSVRFDGHEVLADLTVEGTPRAWTHGCFAMAPYAGRVYGGVLHDEGEEITLRGPGTDGHVMHGVTSDRAWTRLDQLSARIDLDDRWPFGGWAEQRLVVTDDAVTVTLTVHNEERAMPAWLGFHPWFRRSLGTGGPLEITSDLGSMYEKDADGRLTGRTVAVPTGPHDDCFLAPELPVRLEWPGALTRAAVVGDRRGGDAGRRRVRRAARGGLRGAADRAAAGRPAGQGAARRPDEAAVALAAAGDRVTGYSEPPTSMATES